MSEKCSTKRGLKIGDSVERFKELYGDILLYSEVEKKYQWLTLSEVVDYRKSKLDEKEEHIYIYRSTIKEKAVPKEEYSKYIRSIEDDIENATGKRPGFFDTSYKAEYQCKERHMVIGVEEGKVFSIEMTPY